MRKFLKPGNFHTFSVRGNFKVWNFQPLEWHFLLHSKISIFLHSDVPDQKLALRSVYGGRRRESSAHCLMRSSVLTLFTDFLHLHHNSIVYNFKYLFKLFEPLQVTCH